MKMFFTAVALAAFVGAPAMAQQTFDFTYSLGDATASGTFDLAHSGNVLAAGDYAGLISNVHMTIIGASSGNGTFTSADFGFYYFNTSTALDLTQELVGQSEGGGNVFGDQSTASDLNFFGNGGSAPVGVYFFQLGTDGGSGDQLRLTSLHLDGASGGVPEPASWAMMLGGSGVIGGALRSRRKTAVTFA